VADFGDGNRKSKWALTQLVRFTCPTKEVQ